MTKKDQLNKINLISNLLIDFKFNYDKDSGNDAKDEIWQKLHNAMIELAEAETLISNLKD